MRAAFSSTKQAAVFALLLLGILFLPAVMGKNLLPPREQAYSIQAWCSGSYPWIRNQIFEETNPIDIAFVGSSHIAFGINTPYVQEKLSEKLGRPSVVRTFFFGGAGYDALYFMTQDLLSHRRVRMLVFYDENSDVHNSQIPTLFRFADNAEALPGLSVADSAIYYFASIVGMPRNLLCLIRPNLPAPLVTDKPNYWTLMANAPNPATQFGCLSDRLGFRPNQLDVRRMFEPYLPETPASPMDALVYSPVTKSNFEFATVPLPAWQTHFVRKFASLLKQNGVQSVMLYLPGLVEMRSSAIYERTLWPDYLDKTILLGIPPTKFFFKMTDDEAQKLYDDPQHFNQNGQEFFTRLITPTLLKLYENSTNH